MSVQFIIGRAGSGKSHWCCRAIVEDLRAAPLGPPIYWILPRQATFDAERELACASGLGGFCRARVLSFEQLADDLLAECGGAAAPRITHLGRQMILGLLLRRHQKELRFFASVAHQPGLAAELEATFCELERAGKGPEELAALAQTIGAGASGDDGDPLADKLHDIRLIYDAYNRYLGQDRLDPHRWMRQVLSVMGSSRRFAAALVYVDEFWEFDQFEQQLLLGLARSCAAVRITLLMDAAADGEMDELELFHRVRRTHRTLTALFSAGGIQMDPPVVLAGARRFESAQLAALEQAEARGLPTGPVPPPAGSAAGDIELVEAPDRRAEVEHAARAIVDWARQGMRFRDIVVLTRKLSLYQELVSAIFAEHAIQCFIDSRRSVSHHPLLQFLRAAMAVARGGWPHEPLMAMIKSGLAALDRDQADALENYVLEHCLRGGVWTMPQPWRWGTRFRDESAPADADAEQPSVRGPEPAEQMDELRRRLTGPIEAFMAAMAGGPHPLRQVVGDLFTLLEAYGVRETLARWIDDAHASGAHERAQEHLQVWRDTVALFDHMVELMGDEPVGLDDFHDILEAGLASFDTALTPPTVDQVLVGQIDRTRTPAVKAAILLGMNDGVFPHAPRFVSVFSDRERIELRRHGVDLPPGVERRLLDEDLLAYIAFSRPSRRLLVLRSLSDEQGRPLGPSTYWQRLLTRFPGLVPLRLPPAGRTQPSQVSTPRQLLTGLMHWARRIARGEADDGAWPALYHWLSQQGGDDRLARLRDIAWPALSYRNEASLDAALAAALFPSGLVASAYQVESFASCPFQHFAGFGLRLEPRREGDLQEVPVSPALHAALADLARHLLGSSREWSSILPAHADRLIESYAQRLAERLGDELFLGAGRNRHVIQRLHGMLDEIVLWQRELEQRSSLRLALADVRFGEGGTVPALTIDTPAGRQVRIVGRIDRVDVLARRAAFAVLDYRLKGAGLSLNEVYHGRSLHLLTCMLAMRAAGGPLSGEDLAPAAALYVPLQRCMVDVSHPDEKRAAVEVAQRLGPKRRGLFDSSYLRELDNELEAGSDSDLLAARINKDGKLGSTGDGLDAEEIRLILDLAQRQLGRLADQIMEGRIEVAPYRSGTSTPCPACAFRAVCRFDTAVNRYRHTAAMSTEQVIALAKEQADER